MSDTSGSFPPSVLSLGPQPLVAALAARNATEVQIARLERQLSRRRLSNPSGSLGSHIARFRLEVADCANNVALAAVVRAVAGLSWPLSFHSIGSTDLSTE